MTDLPEGVAVPLTKRYFVFEEGRIWSVKKSDYLSTYLERDTGHVMVSMSFHGKTSARRLDRVVAEAFIGPKPSPDARVEHINGDKTDCRACNLQWQIPAKAQKYTASSLTEREKIIVTRLRQRGVHDLAAQIESGLMFERIAT